jgi:hypothetical protein
METNEVVATENKGVHSDATILYLRTKKVVYRGEKVYEILDFSCYNLEDDALPHKYFEEYPYCFEIDGQFVIVTNDKEFVSESPNYNGKENSFIFEVGDYIQQENFEKLLKILRVCGEKLHNINQEIKVMRLEWKGKKDFEI